MLLECNIRFWHHYFNVIPCSWKSYQTPRLRQGAAGIRQVVTCRFMQRKCANRKVARSVSRYYRGSELNVCIYSLPVSQGIERTQLLILPVIFLTLVYRLYILYKLYHIYWQNIKNSIELKKLAEYILLEVTEAIRAGVAERKFILSQVVLYTLASLPRLI